MNGVIFALDQIGQLAQAQAAQLEQLSARNDELERENAELRAAAVKVAT